MKIANGVEMLEITANLVSGKNTIHPTLVWNEDTAILIDTGYPDKKVVATIQEEMLKAGVSMDKLRKVIITHQDIDHIGGLPLIVEMTNGKVEVLAHTNEKPYIQADKPLIKFSPEAIKRWPEDRLKMMKSIIENPPKAFVDKEIADEEELPYCGGITVIHTPGHTPGHICLYLRESKTLITGDAMNVIDGKLVGPNPQFTYDMDLALNSLKKLAKYDVKHVICYHGGLFNDNPNQHIAEIANE